MSQPSRPRLRILDIPGRVVGQFYEARYALIIDRCPADTYLGDLEQIRKDLGTDAVIVFPIEVDLGDDYSSVPEYLPEPEAA